MNNFTDILNGFKPISLDGMDSVRLMNRTDTKFIFNINKLPEILKASKNNYKLLEINNKQLLDYRTQYYDTNDFKLFLLHHNKKQNRYKLRQREYLISDISFFEIKFKSNKGRTIKKRFRTKGLEHNLTPKFKQFINKNTPFSGNEFVSSIQNNFTRITLVHALDNERVTIDIDLEYKFNNKYVNLPFLAIAEVKREGYKKSDFIEILKDNKIYTQSMSKYAIGVLLLNNNIKYNNFKEKILTLKKIANNDKYNSVFSKY